MIDTPRKPGSNPPSNKTSSPLSSFYDEADPADNTSYEETASSEENEEYASDQYAQPEESPSEYDENTQEEVSYDDSSETEESYDTTEDTVDDYEAEAPLEDTIAPTNPSFFKNHYNTIVTVGVVLFIGLISYWQFGDSLFNSSSTPSTPPPMPSLNTAVQNPMGTPNEPAPSASTPSAPAPANSNPPLGILPEPPTPNVNDGRPYIAGPSEPTENVFQTPAPQPSNQSEATLPSTNSLETETTAPISGSNEPTGMNAPPVDQTSSTPVDSGISTPASPDANVRLDALELQLADITTRLGQMQTSLDTLSQTSAAATQDLQTTDKLNQLQQTVDQLAQKVETLSNTTKPSKPSTAATSTSSPPRTASKTETSSSTKWVIRSATQGQAWVTLGNVQRRVVPGDTLKGIGEIKNIRQIDGRWVIEGTEGKIQ